MNRLRYLIFFVGLAIALLMAFRAQAHRDQLFLLYLGCRLMPFGPHISGGGLYPGYLASLLSGIPLLIWEDYRAGGLLVLLLRAAAYLGLDRALRGHLDERERLLLCVFYWLSPWSLHFSAHLWAPNWVFLFGVLHTWTALRQRIAAGFVDSFLHVLAIGAVGQFHGSALILAVVSVLLFLRGYMRVHWGGVLAAVGVTFASVLPWIMLLAKNPLWRPGGEGFLGYGLVAVHPILKGAAYWVRFPSMWFRFTSLRFDFTPALGEQADAVLTPVMWVLTWVVGTPTVFICLAAFIWFWKLRPPGVFSRIPAEAPAREWLVGFVRWTFLGSVITFALNPSAATSWQVFVIMHVTVLPTVFWLANRWKRGSPKWISKAIAVHIVLLALISLAMSLGSPMYRKGGRFCEAVVVKEPYPLLERFGVDRHVTVVIDEERGYSLDPDEHAVRDD
jgi:hypothetical protein